MSNLSQFFGGGGVPVGSLVSAPFAKINFTDGAAEYLRTGSIKTYSATYDTALAAQPQLGVYGNDTAQKGTTTGTAFNFYGYVGTNYFTTGNNNYSADLSMWNAATYTNSFSSQVRPAVGNGYGVVVATGVNLAHQYTTNGSTFSSVGGTFTTCPVKTAICYAPSVGWLALSSLAGTAGEQSYIANINPTGSWTVGAGTNVSMTAVKAVAYGNGVFVAVGTSVGAYGKIATCSTLGGTWTDRTSGASFITLAGYDGVDVVFTGTHFVAIFNPGIVARSTDGITWTRVTIPQVGPQYANYLATDGAGKVVACPAASGTSTNLPVFYYSMDHGATWVVRQMYVGKVAGQAGYCTPSYANGKWIINHGGAYQSPQDLGSMSAPDFVGIQTSFGIEVQQHVRIK